MSSQRHKKSTHQNSRVLGRARGWPKVLWGPLWGSWGARDGTLWRRTTGGLGPGPKHSWPQVLWGPRWVVRSTRLALRRTADRAVWARCNWAGALPDRGVYSVPRRPRWPDAPQPLARHTKGAPPRADSTLRKGRANRPLLGQCDRARGGERGQRRLCLRFPTRPAAVDPTPFYDRCAKIEKGGVGNGAAAPLTRSSRRGAGQVRAPRAGECVRRGLVADVDVVARCPPSHTSIGPPPHLATNQPHGASGVPPTRPDSAKTIRNKRNKAQPIYIYRLAWMSPARQ